MDPSDDIPFPALPEKESTPSPSPTNADVPAPHVSESTEEAFEREILEFVTERLNEGIEENELVDEVREFGLVPKKAREYVRSVSAYNLEENYEPEVRALIADLVAAGKTPFEIVEALQEQDLTADESWRLLRDVEAMKLEIAEGRAAIRRAQIIYLVTVLINIATCLLAGAVSLLGGILLFVWAARMYSRGKKRVDDAEHLIDPPPSAGSRRA
jgi:hypothetical protein